MPGWGTGVGLSRKPLTLPSPPEGRGVRKRKQRSESKEATTVIGFITRIGNDFVGQEPALWAPDSLAPKDRRSPKAGSCATGARVMKPILMCANQLTKGLLYYPSPLGLSRAAPREGEGGSVNRRRTDRVRGRHAKLPLVETRQMAGSQRCHVFAFAFLFLSPWGRG